MSVSIDRVYQTVLAIVNKEGGSYIIPNGKTYISPQEFNLLANQAQIEIFESYFYELGLHLDTPRNDDDHADTVRNLQEKIRGFETASNNIDEDPTPIQNGPGQTVNVGGAVEVNGVVFLNVSPSFILLTEDTVFTDPLEWRDVTATNTPDVFRYPEDFYRLGRVTLNNRIVDEVSDKQCAYILLSPLTAPTRKQAVYVRREGGVCIFPVMLANTDIVNMSYIRTPAVVSWMGSPEMGQFIETGSVNFELHPSEFPELVTKILSYVGIIIQRADIAQLAEAQEQVLTGDKKQ